MDASVRALAAVLAALATAEVAVGQPTFFKSTFKGLHGLAPRAQDESRLRVVYYYDQTVAVVDLAANNELHDCNFIEVYEPEESEDVLRNLSATTQPQPVTFPEMTKLTDQCETLEKWRLDNRPHVSASRLNKNGRPGISSLTLLSGIAPGTKWCGMGDIADDYHDLGQVEEVDRCCRRHDLCPVKIRAQDSRYNLTNYSLYTKSHCSCDQALYRCLKEAEHPTANVLGHIYFNIVRVPCIEEPASVDSGRRFVSALANF